MGGGIKSLSDNVTLWVDGDDGSDENGDGTQERPFKTFTRASVWAHCLHTNSYNVYIDFLTDYEEADTVSHNITGDFHYNSRYLRVQNSLNKNVTLGQFIVAGCALQFRGSFALRYAGGYTLQSAHNGIISMDGQIAVNTGTAGPCIHAAMGGRVVFRVNLALTLRGETVVGAVLILNNGIISHINAAATDMSLTFEGNFKTCFQIENNSCLLRMNKASVDGSAATIARKYLVARHSYMDTGGRGADWLPGETAGTCDETSIIQ